MEKSSVIYVLDSNKNSREILKSYIDDFNLNVEIKIFSDYRIGVNDIKAEENIPIVFVDISETKPEMLESIESIRLLTPKIIITSNDYSTSTIIQAMRLGAKEFLPKPIIKEDLLRIITML